MLLYQDDPKKISQFFIKLLKPLPGWRLVSPENWFESLGKEYKKREIEIDFPIPSTSSTILSIPLLQRLEILRNLCEFHLEQPEHFWELLKVKDEESNLRIEPIGIDSLNRRYWVFSDGRMFREIEGIDLKNNRNNKNNKKKVKKSNSKNENENENEILWDIEDENNWELVCLTRSDYDEFLNNFSTLKSLPIKDRSLSKIIKNEIVPKVEPILNFQLSQHKKYFKPVVSERICLLPRKRSSRLIEKEIEEEQRKEAEKLADKERLLQARSRSNLNNEIVNFNEKGEDVINRDLSVEREIRAEMRRNKREREMQVKAIEEAFYQNYEVSTTGTNNSDDTENESLKSEINEEVEIISSSSEEGDECINEFTNNITTSYNYNNHIDSFPLASLESTQKSPFKLILKMKTSTPVVQATETVSQNLNDVDISGDEHKKDDKDLITNNKVEVEAQVKDVLDDNLVIIDECIKEEESEPLVDSHVNESYIIPVCESTTIQTNENEKDIAQILLTKFSRPDSPNK